MSNYVGMGSTNRDEWEFEYANKELFEAALTQLDYRQGRVRFWEDNKVSIMDEIKASGLSVYESEAEKMSSYSLGNSNRTQVRVDPKFQTQLDETTGKIRENRELVKEYSAWVQLLKAQPAAGRLRLKHGDWMFFFGK